MSTIPSFRSSTLQQQPQIEAHLPFCISVCGDETEDETTSQGVTLVGYTRSASADTLSLVAPFYQFGYRYLMGRDRTLQMELHLPTGPISLQGFPVRYTKLSDDEPGDGYMMTGPDPASFNATDVNCLIEVSIVVISDDNQTRFIEHLHQLDKAENEHARPLHMLEEALLQGLAA